jgi:hypothetical protein
MQSILTPHPQPARTLPRPPLPQPPAPAPPRLRPLLRLVCCPARAATPTPTSPTPPPQSPALPLSQLASRALLLPLAPATARTLTMAQSSPPLAPQARPQPATQAHPRLALLAAPRAVLRQRVLLRAWAWRLSVLLRSVLLAPCLLCKRLIWDEDFRIICCRVKSRFQFAGFKRCFTHISLPLAGRRTAPTTTVHGFTIVLGLWINLEYQNQDTIRTCSDYIIFSFWAQNGRHYSAFSKITIDKNVTLNVSERHPVPAMHPSTSELTSRTFGTASRDAGNQS